MCSVVLDSCKAYRCCPSYARLLPNLSIESESRQLGVYCITNAGDGEILRRVGPTVFPVLYN